MKDTVMIKCALVMVLIGLPLIALVSAYQVPKKENTELFSDQSLVRVDGVLKDVAQGDVSRALLETCVQMPVVAFDEVVLKEKKSVEILASKERYKGKPQLRIEQLRYI